MLGIEKEGLIKVDDSHTPVNCIVSLQKGLSVSSKRVYLFREKVDLFNRKGRPFSGNR